MGGYGWRVASTRSLLASEPGLGKSQITVAMAAPITNGGCWPFSEGRAPLGSVIILAAEDSVEHTTVPRLIAAGADLERVHFVQAAVAEDGNGQRMFNFQADIAKLRALIREIGDVVLVIIDPVTAYMGKIIQTISCALRTLDLRSSRPAQQQSGAPRRYYLGLHGIPSGRRRASELTGRRSNPRSCILRLLWIFENRECGGRIPSRSRYS
jgi:hypothetical protein